MAGKVPSIKLNNGLEMPLLGLGTWRTREEAGVVALKLAIDIGYRHFDTAFLYMNEKELGRAINEKIKDGTVTRDELFIVSKAPPTFRTRERVQKVFKKSLEKFGLEYLDLYLIHSPVAAIQVDDALFPKAEDGETVLFDESIDFLDTWKGMEDLVDAGLCKSIGISNFSVAQTERVLANCRIKPVTNQVECHPFLNENEFIKKHKELDVIITAYSPLATVERIPILNTEVPQVLDNEVLLEIGQKYNKSATQVALRYQIDRNVAVIPKSSTEKNLRNNFDIFDFKLSDEDIKKIDGIKVNARLFQGADYEENDYYPWI